MTPIEKAIAQLGGLRKAAGLFDVAGYQALQSWIRLGRVPAEYCPLIEHLTGVRCEDLNGRVDWSLIRGTTCTVGADEPLRARMLQLAGEVAAAKEDVANVNTECKRLRDSNNEAREKLGAELARTAQLEQQVLTLFGPAGAQVDHAAELRRAISETRIVFESEPAAGEVLNYLQAVLDAGAPVPAQTGIPGGGTASIAEETPPGAGAGAEPVAGADFFAALAHKCARQVAADQAAAAMAAESAQLVAQAEKAAAGAAARAAVDPLAVLSREMFSLADKLQQPADLVVQLMVLAELRCQRADHARSNQPLTVVLS